MKAILFCVGLFCVIALPAIGELTDTDLDKIRLIIKDKVSKEIASSETRMKSYVDTKVESLKTPVRWLIGILVAFIALIGLSLAILRIFLAWRSIKDTSQEKQIEELTREVEMLKQRQIINP